MKKIAVIGYGALGKIFVDAMKRILPDVYEVEGIFVRNRETVEKSLEELGIRVYQSFDELLCADVEYVVEIASVQAVADYGVRILESGKNLIVTSVGALRMRNFGMTWKIWQKKRTGRCSLFPEQSEALICCEHFS